ncbi:ZinT/AdcA family metal-binding protein [Paracoccus litorisediminis]|uniref:ZinT/AdcA family metal-binding protein n=2 Tax=Paracoccus litorisediminis TaxID=2006130 RepID=A0A844HJM5_9RHOB|nr:ZinT/AdcA family metal-binding protein [Paracoccus litorisediminis]
MRDRMSRQLGAAIMGAFMLGGLAQVAYAETTTAAHSHDHAHDHDHAHEADSAIAKGHFADEQIRPRALSDWQGDWQSVYPHLQAGTLDPVMAHKAEHGDKTAAEYRAYYETGYKTDIGRITINGDEVTFHGAGGAVAGHYASDGFEILTYKAGNRGVRYVFEKTSGDPSAPKFIQFSDHAIAPVKAGHYHLYWGDDRAALLAEVTNWPTYYPAALDGAGIRAEMMAH